MPGSLSLSKGPTIADLLYVGFNQDDGCFACGTDTGFRIYNSNPLKETIKKEFPGGGGIGIVEMLFRCNILAIVGGGKNPRFPPNKVMIWDDKQSRCIGEISLISEVKAVKLRRDRIICVTMNTVSVYNFADLTKLHQLETCDNEHGLVALCVTTPNNTLVCPDVKKGWIQIENYTKRTSIKVPAHESELAALAINLDGTKIASASEKGTLIRVFSASSGNVLNEFRRGTDRAWMYCISFDPTDKFLACSSDKGTIHIFSLDESKASEDGGIKKEEEVVEGKDAEASPPNGGVSTFGFMKSLLPTYFSSVWSYAQFRVPDTRSICAFTTEPYTLIILSADGSAYKVDFSKGGECVKTWFSKFVKGEEES